MGLSSAVGWWEEWQLRILVLGSLFIQQTWDGESSALEVLWAPALLIHLGGQPFISAYSLEDNELWKRHTITLVCQVTVALYVFCKWWSGKKTLLAAAILLFVLGIIKVVQKPWALRIASFNSMETSSTVSWRARREGSIYSLEEYVQAAKKCVLETKVDGKYEYERQSDYMFADMSVAYSFRIARLLSFLLLEEKHAYNALQKCLDDASDMLYTRLASMFNSRRNASLVFLLPIMSLASMLLFAMSHKDGQNKKDISVTYVILCGTTMLEFMLPCVLLSCLLPWCFRFHEKYTFGWDSMVSQYNLMSFCVRKKKPTCLMKLATFNFLREFVSKHFYIQHVPRELQITGLVCRHVEDGWKKYVHDAASYRRFSELRGQWALRRHHQLGWSLKMPYDESVVIWHISTDLCFYHVNTSPRCRQGEATQRSREISNHIIYLLLIRPEMLMPGTRSDLFTLASDIIVVNSKWSLEMTENSVAQDILYMPVSPSAADMVSNAVILSKELMELGDEKERWTVIQGVWVEMLCYSASRCRGYLHAKSLGDGGEYLSMVWLLWSFMGMETFADRHQKSEPPQEEEEEV